MARTERQEEAAATFLRRWPEGEIFGSALGRMHGVCEQLDSDIDYANAIMERHAASLRSGSEQLQIAGQRQLGEMGHHIAIETAAVVASVAALIVVELLKAHQTLENRPALATNMIFLGVTGPFFLVQWLTRGGEAKTWLEPVSFAAMIGFAVGSAVAKWRGETRFWVFG